MDTLDKIDTKTGEVIEEQALIIPSEKKLSSLVKDIDKPLFESMAQVVSLDWKNLPPNLMAFILTQKQYPVSGGGYTTLSFRQALVYALRCYELGLSPLGAEVFYNSTTGSVNVTLEGRRTLARNRGIELGPPVFTEITRAWSDLPRPTKAAEEAKKLGFTSDLGVTCKMRIGPVSNNEHISYTAFLSEWMVGKSPVWQEKANWMLSVRAQDKCLAMALGAGVSEAQD